MKKILKPYQKNGFSLQNHMVMAPMTRCRAIDNLPNELMVEYYSQRSEAGLIITEGTAPVPDGLGYARIPGIYNAAQVERWKKITDRVHENGAKIFMQLMHTGRVGHADNLPPGARLVGVSDKRPANRIFTDRAGLQENSEVAALTTAETEAVVEGFVQAARNAVEAGFDGVEMHSANGYLLEQFLNAELNDRTDKYGGSIENRSRLVVEIVRGVAAAIGKEKTGIRFSPYSTYNDLPAYDEELVHQTYAYLAAELDAAGIAYIHISANANIPGRTYEAIRRNFSNTIIICNGLTPDAAEARLADGFADIVAFGGLFLANPDLVSRVREDAPLTNPDASTYFTATAHGYTDYPLRNMQAVM